MKQSFQKGFYGVRNAGSISQAPQGSLSFSTRKIHLHLASNFVNTWNKVAIRCTVSVRYSNNEYETISKRISLGSLKRLISSRGRHRK
jgi:hypothetical protein